MKSDRRPEPIVTRRRCRGHAQIRKPVRSGRAGAPKCIFSEFEDGGVHRAIELIRFRLAAQILD